MNRADCSAFTKMYMSATIRSCQSQNIAGWILGIGRFSGVRLNIIHNELPFLKIYIYLLSWLRWKQDVQWKYLALSTAAIHWLRKTNAICSVPFAWDSRPLVKGTTWICPIMQKKIFQLPSLHWQPSPTKKECSVPIVILMFKTQTTIWTPW